MRRLAFALALVILAAPIAAEAQQQPAKVFRIGLLGPFQPTDPRVSRTWAGFFQGLRELGYVEGQNLVIEGRYSEGRAERLPALAAELVRLQVDVIVTGSSPAPEAAKQATSTIPIVFTNHPDPVGSGLVASLARPGGERHGPIPPHSGARRQAPPAAQGGRSPSCRPPDDADDGDPGDQERA